MDFMDCHKGLFHVHQLDGKKSNKIHAAGPETSYGGPAAACPIAFLQQLPYHWHATMSPSSGADRVWTRRNPGLSADLVPDELWICFRLWLDTVTIIFFSCFFLHTLPKTSSSPLKIGHLKKKFHLPTIDFWCYDVSLREGIIKYDWIMRKLPKARGISVPVHRKSVVPPPLGLNQDFRKTFFLAIVWRRLVPLDWLFMILKCKQWDLQLKTQKITHDGSIYGTFAYILIHHLSSVTIKNQPNVENHTIHGSYG